MNNSYDDQNKKIDTTSNMLDDDLQNEKSEQNTSKRDRDEEMTSG